MEADIHNGAVRIDQFQTSGQDPHAQVACIAPAQGSSVEGGASASHRMVGELVLHPVKDPVVHGGRRRRAHIDRRYSVRRGHRPHRGAVLPWRHDACNRPKAEPGRLRIGLHGWQVASRFEVFGVGQGTPLRHHGGADVARWRGYGGDRSPVTVGAVSAHGYRLVLHQVRQALRGLQAIGLAALRCVDLVDPHALRTGGRIHLQRVAIDHPGDRGGHAGQW